MVGTAVVGTAVVATDRRTSGAQVDDEAIELKASSRLERGLPRRAGDVSVTSYNRMVLLTGEVPSEADKTTVEQVVARIDNVVSVVNELERRRRQRPSASAPATRSSRPRSRRA